MTPEQFSEKTLELLFEDDEQALNELVAQYQPQANEVPNQHENEALQWLGKFGCSGRTTRYKSLIDSLLSRGLQPDLISCAYLGLFDRASEMVAGDSTIINARDASGASALHAATERGDLHMVRWLCESGAKATLRTDEGELPIVRAMHAGPWKSSSAEDVIAYLAPRCGVENELWFAAATGNLERVRSLLVTDSQAVDEFDASGETPLFHACHNNHASVVVALLAAGAQPNLETQQGESPLSTACLHRLSGECDIAIIEGLLKAGAIKTMSAAVIVQDLDFLRSEIPNQLEHLDPTNADGALHCAAHTGSGASLEALLELGGRPDEALWKEIERIFGSDESLMRRLEAYRQQ